MVEVNPDADSASTYRYTTTDSEGGSSKATSNEDHVVEGSDLVAVKTIAFTNDCTAAAAADASSAATPATAAPATPDTSDASNVAAMQTIAALGGCLIGAAAILRFGKKHD